MKCLLLYHILDIHLNVSKASRRHNRRKKKHAITKLYIVYNSISIRTHGSYAQSQFQQDLTGDILVVAHFLKVT